MLDIFGLCCADLKNAARELYGLVNYGEIRKKIGFCTEKIMCMKLNELVYKGTIQIRIKGKTLRIKTPLCRALRKLNRLQGMYTVNFMMQ
jgi:DNA-binding HxlR family transcriptional regulator